MALSKHGLKALSLCALVLGLMALSAGSAQAEVGAHWNVNGASISAELKPALQVKELENKTSTLLSKILGLPYSLLCTAAVLETFILTTNGGSTGKIKFTGCIAFVNGVRTPECDPVGGIVQTNALKDLIVLHKLESGVVDTLDRLEPVEGEIFTTVKSSEGCAVGLNIPIKGKFFIKDCKNEFSVEKVEHLIEQGPLTHLFVISDTPEHAATIDGSAILVLTGAHATLQWSGTAI